ncbi:hypothetical protein MNBD_PLANCTO02-2853 [hydrothermal vent metagenome]|uniref:Uncharacterized protein n=1 Tax=hydrothermal vent metagenome TaxID=652676 RepID=A0A3B1DFA8_9ZZZZ
MNTSNEIGIEYLSWINREMKKVIKQSETTERKNKFQLSNNVYLMTILVLFLPYLIVGFSIYSLNLLHHI